MTYQVTRKNVLGKKTKYKKQIKTKLVSFSFDLRKIMLFEMKHMCHSLVYSKTFFQTWSNLKNQLTWRKGMFKLDNRNSLIVIFIGYFEKQQKMETKKEDNDKQAC
jgi:hypothetical protein